MGALDIGVEADVGSDAKALGRLAQVIMYLVARREKAAPGIGFAEGVGIGVIGGVDPGPRILIFEPDTAHVRMPLDDRVRQIEPLKPGAKRNAADACADDQDGLDRFDRAISPRDISRNEAKFLAHQRRIFRRDVFSQAQIHHPLHQRITGISDRRLALDF